MIKFISYPYGDTIRSGECTNIDRDVIGTSNLLLSHDYYLTGDALQTGHVRNKIIANGNIKDTWHQVRAGEFSTKVYLEVYTKIKWSNSIAYPVFLVRAGTSSDRRTIVVSSETGNDNDFGSIATDSYSGYMYTSFLLTGSQSKTLWTITYKPTYNTQATAYIVAEPYIMNGELLAWDIKVSTSPGAVNNPEVYSSAIWSNSLKGVSDYKDDIVEDFDQVNQSIRDINDRVSLVADRVSGLESIRGSVFVAR